MAAGLGYIEFTTGDVLTAALANGYLASQTVMVFADSAARATAITSPQEGMFSYLKDSNSTQYYSGSAWVSIGGASPLTTKGDVYTYSTTDARLAVGTNGQVLTADSTAATGIKWATAAAGMTLLSTTALSGSSTSISAISGSYKELVIWIKDPYASSATNIALSANSGTAMASFLDLGGRAGTYEQIKWNDDNLLLWMAMQSNTDNNNFVEIRIPDYANTNTMKMVLANSIFYNTDPYRSMSMGIGMFSGTSAISEIALATTAGTWSAGSVEVYGVN